MGTAVQANSSGIDRQPFKLPPNFNPDSKSHRGILVKLAEEKLGDGFELEAVEMDTGYAYFTRHTATMSVTDSGGGTSMKKVRLPGDIKPTDGAKWAAKYADTFPGYEMTEFNPYLGEAVLAMMPEDVRSTRSALANALGCKPWEVQVTKRRGGGYMIGLPRTYVPSKHDDKLDEVATSIIGSPGWYMKCDASTLQAEMIPSDPPTFDAMYAPPMGRAIDFDHTNKAHFQIPIGRALPEPGVKIAPEFCLDMDAGAHMQVGGISGGGKSVLLNGYIAQWLARNAELVIIDIPAKAADFEWCKEFVRPGGWGCESPAESAVAIDLVQQEGENRGKILKQHGVNDWKKLPVNAKLRPLLVVVDELTGLYALENVPKITKNSPQRLIDMAERAEITNFYKEMLKSGIKRTAAELRFTGVFLVISSQLATVNTGIDTALRINLHHKALMGVKPTDGNRKLVFSDIERVPQVPDHIKSDPSAGRGSGAAEPEGAEPLIFKSYYADTGEYQEWLRRIGTQTTNQPAPTAAQIAEFLGEEDLDATEPDPPTATASRRASMKDPMLSVAGLELGGTDYDGKPLSGAAKAAAQSKALAALSSKQRDESE